MSLQEYTSFTGAYSIYYDSARFQPHMLRLSGEVFVTAGCCNASSAATLVLKSTFLQMTEEHTSETTCCMLMTAKYFTPCIGDLQYKENFVLAFAGGI